jgi:hypothetical protein
MELELTGSSRAARGQLAEPPKRPVCLEGSDGFVSSPLASIATGWSDPVAGWELHPLKTNTFYTAHNKSDPEEGIVPQYPAIWLRHVRMCRLSSGPSIGRPSAWGLAGSVRGRRSVFIVWWATAGPKRPERGPRCLDRLSKLPQTYLSPFLALARLDRSHKLQSALYLLRSVTSEVNHPRCSDRPRGPRLTSTRSKDRRRL